MQLSRMGRTSLGKRRCDRYALGLAVGQMAQVRLQPSRVVTAPRSSEHAPVGNAGLCAGTDIPMTWDFAESQLSWVAERRQLAGCPRRSVLGCLRRHAPPARRAWCESTPGPTRCRSPGLVATDPPYFDAIGYADLSDYFYMWHRRALRAVHPDLYATIATPKAGELTAVPAPSWEQ